MALAVRVIKKTDRIGSDQFRLCGVRAILKPSDAEQLVAKMKTLELANKNFRDKAAILNASQELITSIPSGPFAIEEYDESSDTVSVSEKDYHMSELLKIFYSLKRVEDEITFRKWKVGTTKGLEMLDGRDATKKRSILSTSTFNLYLGMPTTLATIQGFINARQTFTEFTVTETVRRCLSPAIADESDIEGLLGHDPMDYVGNYVTSKGVKFLDSTVAKLLKDPNYIFDATKIEVYEQTAKVVDCLYHSGVPMSTLVKIRASFNLWKGALYYESLA